MFFNTLPWLHLQYYSIINATARYAPYQLFPLSNIVKKYQKRRLGNFVLSVFKKLAEDFSIMATTSLPSYAQIMRTFNPHTKYEKQKVKRAIDSLYRYGLVSVKPGKSIAEKSVRMTLAGKELAEYLFRSLPKQKKWDGKWRIIAFDVPEPYSTARRALSLKLRELGCYHYQNSVFVYPYDCEEEINFIRNYFGFDSAIKYIVAEKLDDEKTLEEFFKL